VSYRDDGRCELRQRAIFLLAEINIESMNSSTGRPPRESDETILAVLRSTEDPVLSTADIADKLTIKRRSTLNRLRDLETKELVESKQIGGRNTVWWLSTKAIKTHTISENDTFFSEGPLFGSETPLSEDDIDNIVYPQPAQAQ